MILKYVSLISFLAYNGQKDCRQSATTASGTQAPLQICGGALIFEDNFKFFNLKKWIHEENDDGGGNGEFQIYVNSRENSFTKNNVLHIRPTLTSSAEKDYFNDTSENLNDIPSPIRSARLVTKGSFAFKFGRIEISAKMPGGDWLWPAIWFLPEKNGYGSYMANGEIDLTETRGNRDYSINGYQIGTQQTGATLHFGPNLRYDGFKYACRTRNNPKGYDTGFHKYEMIWTPNEITFKLDDSLLLNVPAGNGFWERGHFQKLHVRNPWTKGTKMAPFDKEFHFIINLAIGGSFFSDDFHNSGGKPWKNGSPHPKQDFWNGRQQWLKTWRMNTDDSHLQIKYVKVWAL